MMSTKRLFSGASLLTISTLLLCGCHKQEEPTPPASQVDARTRSLQATASPDHSHSELPPFHPPREFKPRPTLKTTDPTSNDYIREWNWFTTVGDYQRAGRTNPAWDANAIEAMERYCDARALNQSGGTLADLQKRAGEAAAKGIEARCDDPLVEYIHTRFVISRQSDATPARLGELYADCADHFEKTDYAPVRKMYADLRASEAMKESLGNSTNMPPRLTASETNSSRHFTRRCHYLFATQNYH